MQYSPQQKIEIKSCLQEISNSLTRIEAERDLIKEIFSRMADEFEISKRLAGRLAKVYHKRNIEEEVAQVLELNDTYDMLTK